VNRENGIDDESPTRVTEHVFFISNRRMLNYAEGKRRTEDKTQTEKGPKNGEGL
jgi:hypothetical protein